MRRRRRRTHLECTGEHRRRRGSSFSDKKFIVPRSTFQAGSRPNDRVEYLAHIQLIFHFVNPVSPLSLSVQSVTKAGRQATVKEDEATPTTTTAVNLFCWVVDSNFSFRYAIRFYFNFQNKALSHLPGLFQGMQIKLAVYVHSSLRFSINHFVPPEIEVMRSNR